MNREIKFKLNGNICIMNAEIIGMYEAIKFGINEGRRRIAIFSDSQCGMKNMSDGGGKNGNVYVDKLYECVRQVDCRVVIQYIPSHRGIEGNERADDLAKQGASNGDVRIYGKSDVRDVLRVIELNVWNKWKSEYNRKCEQTGKKYYEWNRTPRKIPFYKEFKGDSRMIRTIGRIRMNHGNWRECLFKRRLSDDNLCERCMIVEDIEHLLIVCPIYHQERQQFPSLRSGKPLNEILCMNGVTNKELYEFISVTGIRV